MSTARIFADWAWESHERGKSRLFPQLICEGILTQAQVDSLVAARLAKAEELEALVPREAQPALFPERKRYHV